MANFDVDCGLLNYLELGSPAAARLALCLNLGYLGEERKQNRLGTIHKAPSMNSN